MSERKKLSTCECVHINKRDANCVRIEKQNGRVISSYWEDEKSNFTGSPSASLAVCRLIWAHKHIWKSLHIQPYFLLPEAPFS